MKQRIKRVVGGSIGMVLFFLGMAAMDSEDLLMPICALFSGLLLLMVCSVGNEDEKEDSDYRRDSAVVDFKSDRKRRR